MIEFLKTQDYEVKDPIYNFDENAGIDVYIPENTPEFVSVFKEKNPGIFIDNGVIKIPAGGDVLIPSGLHTRFSNDMALIFMDKSGIATKNKLKVGACVIDSSYQGICHIHLFNMNKDDSVNLTLGTKICQLVPVKLATQEVKIIGDMNPDDFFTEKTARGAGGFGSTGIN